MKKMTMLMMASASMLLAAPAAENTPQVSPQKGMYIMTKGQGNGMNAKCKTAYNANNRMQMKMMKQKMMINSPFLIKHGLPHMTRMIMPYMNDPAFNLTSDQKAQLAEVRKVTMKAIMEAKPTVMKLRQEIVHASQSGVKADALKDKVAKLALLEAASTMTQLKCIEATKSILTKDQMYFLLTQKNKKMVHGKKMMRQNGQPKMMMMKMNQNKAINK